MQKIIGGATGTWNIPLLAKAVAAGENDPFALFNFGVSTIQSQNTDVGIRGPRKMFAIATDTRVPCARLDDARCVQASQRLRQSIGIINGALVGFGRSGPVVHQRRC